MNSKGCKAENLEANKFCGGCGAALAAMPEVVAVPGEDGAYYCARHVKTVTRLRCGRCEAPICPRCTAYTPAGTRCKSCAKNKIALRPTALLHEAGRALANQSSGGVGRRVWYMALWYLILSFFRNPW